MNSPISVSKKAAGRAKSDDCKYSLKSHYLDQLQFVPGLKDLLDGATLKDDGEDFFVRSASDFSYAADQYAGDHFRLVGDAAGVSAL
jgi:flavine halogenase